jgi:hypothetical protein
MARKEKKYHYIYKITCLKNEKYYIGMHSTFNLEDGYMGGGKRIKNSVKKHGKDAHRKDILEFFETREDLRNREIQLVNEELINDPMCMNIQPGGGGGWSKEIQSMLGKRSNEKQRWLSENDKEWAEKNKKVKSETGSNVFKKLWGAEESREKMLKHIGKTFLGKTHTDHTKKIIGDKNSKFQKGDLNSQFGKIWINSNTRKENKRILPNELDEYLNKGWIRGLKMIYFKK